ncbi:hypothetical protein TNCV_3814121 [Trichonephila clavipes]|nr:hypothetical protein TNCV_3814121 [Trichonephila clavipes]
MADLLPRNRVVPNTTSQRGDTSQVLSSMRSPSSDDLTDDFVNRNLECVSILLSSIWDSDFHGFGNLGLKRGA